MAPSVGRSHKEFMNSKVQRKWPGFMAHTTRRNRDWNLLVWKKKIKEDKEILYVSGKL